MCENGIMRNPRAHRTPRQFRLPIQVAAYLIALAWVVPSNSSPAGQYEYVHLGVHRVTRVDSPRYEDDTANGAGLSLKFRTPANKAAEGVAMTSGYHPPDPGECGQYEVGPLLDAEHLSPRDFWLALISPYVKIVRFRERQDTDPDVVANMTFGERKMDFSVERGTRRALLAEGKIPFQFSFLPNGGRELRELDTVVGPIRGRMSINDALRIFIGSDDFMIRWINDGQTESARFPTVMPLYQEKLFADMSESVCNFGFKELGRVTVTKSRLRSLQEDVASPVEVFDRERIERSGAASIPELLRYATQSAFTRSSGYRLNGAQYAEARGVGPAMVLIEGQRTMASASSLQDSAFDLNSIPLSAVERIEIVPDGGSIVHGVDALGGIVNIVLRRPTENISSEARYGSARGGAIERRMTALARTQSSSWDAVLIADQIDVTNLPGHTRSRYANQDYSRYEGGIDRRSLTSERGNLQSIDRQNMPGFDSPIVGLPSADGRQSFEAADLSAQPNLTSLLRYQSVAPARSRASIVAMGNRSLGAAEISGNALYTRQDTQYTMPPPSVSGALVASNHPQNRLHRPVLYYGLLTGIPSEQYETSSDLFRGAASLNAHAVGWDWELSVDHTEDNYGFVLLNAIDPIAVANSLNTNDDGSALRFFSAAPGLARADLLAQPFSERYASRASHAHLVAKRALGFLPTGDIQVQVGGAWRNEAVRSALVERGASRDVLGGFLNLSVPILSTFTLSTGARYDSYSDGESVTSSQLSFEWNPNESFKLRGDLGERYRPPSLLELHMDASPFDVPITDPKTNQTAIATVIAGGRRDLKPTTAKSGGLGFSLTTQKQLEISLHYWQVEVKDRINVLPLLATLEHEDYLPGRVIRAPSVIEGVPGQIRIIDIGWQNLGEVHAAGLDFKLRKEFPAWDGRLVSELGATWNAHYSYRDLPAQVSRLSDRVGIASEVGTILRHRAIARVAWENSAWRFAANVTAHPSYSDLDALNQSRFTVRSQTLFDLNISRRWRTSSLTVGAINLFDSEPGYANVSTWGYDVSQGDLRGRFLYGEVSIGF
jgi:iron complex outermembrane receptor protein